MGSIMFSSMAKALPGQENIAAATIAGGSIPCHLFLRFLPKMVSPRKTKGPKLSRHGPPHSWNQVMGNAGRSQNTSFPSETISNAVANLQYSHSVGRSHYPTNASASRVLGAVLQIPLFLRVAHCPKGQLPVSQSQRYHFEDGGIDGMKWKVLRGRYFWLYFPLEPRPLARHFPQLT